MWRLIENKNWNNLYTTFSWVRDMEGVIQDPIYHEEGDVLIHTQMVTAALLNLSEYQDLEDQNKEILFAAALMHDIEKRSTTVVENDGSITSKGHAKKGTYTSRELLYRFYDAPFSTRESIAKLVRYHGFPLWFFEKENPLKALRKVSLEVNTYWLYLLAKSDVLGRICFDQEDLLYRVELFKAFCIEQDCFGKAADFASDFGKYHYFSSSETDHNYQPFEGNSFEVILLSGLPGAGKDSFIKKHYPDHAVVSIDELRRTFKIDPKDKKGNGKMVQLAKENARSFLRKKQPFIWNATNITYSIRQQLISLFQDYGAKTKIIYIEVPYPQLIDQNKNRQYAIPESALHQLIRKLEPPAKWEAPLVEFQL